MRAWSHSYEDTRQLLEQFGSPLYVYDETAITAQARRFTSAFEGLFSKQPKNFFAVKALPNPHILKVLAKNGMGLDCSSLPELHLAEQAGVAGEAIIFTSNNTTDEEFNEAVRMGAMINFDDLSLVKRFLTTHHEPLPVAFCRYNPGDIDFSGINQAIIGKSSEAKYGLPKDQIIEAYKLLRDSGVKRFGLHTMLVSNELDYHHHLTIARLMFELAHEISSSLDIAFEMINLGGGFGVAYTPNDYEFDIESYGAALAALYNEMDMKAIGEPRITTENGRWVTADSGYLLTRVINRKDTHRIYVGVDASMANLMRPGMYGAYHGVSVLSDEPSSETETVDICGSLCENNDKFAIQRTIPHTKSGDIIVIHSVGAHGHAMGFQYNGMLRSAEVLMTADEPRLIRRAETEADYFATIV